MNTTYIIIGILSSVGAGCLTLLVSFLRWGLRHRQKFLLSKEGFINIENISLIRKSPINPKKYILHFVRPIHSFDYIKNEEIVINFVEVTKKEFEDSFYRNEVMARKLKKWVGEKKENVVKKAFRWRKPKTDEK